MMRSSDLLALTADGVDWGWILLDQETIMIIQFHPLKVRPLPNPAKTYKIHCTGV